MMNINGIRERVSRLARFMMELQSVVESVKTQKATTDPAEFV